MLLVYYSLLPSRTCLQREGSRTIAGAASYIVGSKAQQMNITSYLHMIAVTVPSSVEVVQNGIQICVAQVLLPLPVRLGAGETRK